MAIPAPKIPVIGIDLGTTFSLAAFIDEAGNPQIIPDELGRRMVPSVVALGDTRRIEVGYEARDQAPFAPESVIYSIKRLIGKTPEQFQREGHHFPYRLDLTDGKMVRVSAGGQSFSPQEISAAILKQLKNNAERFFAAPVHKVVITVPAYFDEVQRQATRAAGEIAGLEVIRILNEPTAAALAYGLDRRKGGEVIIYDLGGGTFDVSVLSLAGGVFKVLSTAGDTYLGGDDFDNAIIDLFRGEVTAFYDLPDFSQSPELLARCRLAAERAKRELSEHSATLFRVEWRDRDFRRPLSREQFEKAITPLVEKTLTLCRSALNDARIGIEAIHEVVLVGGSTRIPLVRKRVADLFKKIPHTGLNPDEVVAYGAAVQASILMGRRRDIALLDVVPLSLGIEIMGGATAKLIPRNNTVPCKATEEFSTFADNQTGVDIHVLQGEREMARDCKSLGRFKLSGLPPMPAGLPRVEVTFAIDSSGLLRVSALEKRSATHMEVAIAPSHGLNEAEIQKIVEDSIIHAMEDFEERKLSDLRVKVDIVVRITERELPRIRGEYDSASVAKIEELVGELKRQLADPTVTPEILNGTFEKLTQLTEPLAEWLVNRMAKEVFINQKADSRAIMGLG